MKVRYSDSPDCWKRRPAADTQRILDQAITILAEYEKQGFKLTVRQLFYQFVARGHLPNTQFYYKKVAMVMRRGRWSGFINWDAFTDETRSLRGASHWTAREWVIHGPQNICHDKWDDQPARVELVVEKDSALSVISPLCERLGLPYFSVRGFSSVTILHEAGLRYADYLKEGKQVVLLHVADHDPSGMSATDVIREDLGIITAQHADDEIVTVERIALTLAQTKKFKLHHQLVKEKDSRAKKYIAKYGTNHVWELDALAPPDLLAIIEGAVSKYRDEAIWKRSVSKEKKDRTELQTLADSYAGS